MVSEFRQRKFLHLYNFFDIDSSGSVNKEDFEGSVDRICEKLEIEKDSTKYETIQEALRNIWESLQKEADADGDGEITRQEWLDMWDNFSQNPSSPFEWQNMYCKFIFDLEDTSGDGAIDIDEYSTVMQLFGFTKEDSEAAFREMADGKESVTWEDFQELWKEYFISDDGDDPGNFIFGFCKSCCH